MKTEQREENYLTFKKQYGHLSSNTESLNLLGFSLKGGSEN
jgi:hypothetical protein